MFLRSLHLVVFAFISLAASAQNVDLFSENNYSSNPDRVPSSLQEL